VTYINDGQLLTSYIEQASEAGFAELVQRHIDLIYSTALRMTRDPDIARDVTQDVFLALAKNARQLRSHPTLAGWLHHTTRNLAANAVRSALRRRVREETAAAMNELARTEPDASWELIAPHLDDGLAELADADREALLLRYFQGKSAREMALLLSVNHAAAQKRVSRALERLREFFAKKGITVGISGLAAVITANAVQAAPAGIALSIPSAMAIAAATSATTITTAATKTIAMTTLQKIILGAVLVATAVTGIYEAREASIARAKLQTIQQQQAATADQIQQLARDRDGVTRQLVALRGDNERISRDPSELLKLRAEVARLRAALQDQPKPSARGAQAQSELDPGYEAWIRRISQLKQRVDQTPEAKIPEFQFLKEEDWMAAARGELDTDEDYRRAFSHIRSSAQSQFLDKAGSALQKYLAANSNQFPAEVLQLRPFFETPPGDDILQRYQVTPASSGPGPALPSQSTQNWVITPKFPEQGEFMALGKHGGVSHAVDSPEMRILAPAMQALLEATPAINGRRQGDINQLGRYLTTPEQKAAYERLMSKRK
jgi:RNA polymerase sigma factor (sigma-70 family)